MLKRRSFWRFVVRLFAGFSRVGVGLFSFSAFVIGLGIGIDVFDECDLSELGIYFVNLMREYRIFFYGGGKLRFRELGIR